MADGTSRSVAQKLAAAKKKHKAYLKQKELQKCKESGDMKDNTSTEISQDTKNFSEDHLISDSAFSQFDQAVQLPTYFDNTNKQIIQNPSNFFDNFTNINTTDIKYSHSEIPASLEGEGHLDEVGTSIQEDIKLEDSIFDPKLLQERFPTQNYFQNNSDNVDNTVIRDPNFSQDVSRLPVQSSGTKLHPDSISIFEVNNDSAGLNVSEEDTTDLMDHLQVEDASFGSNKPKSAETYISNNENQAQMSSIESLIQLSNQMGELIEPNNFEKIRNSESQLEKRNLELAWLLEQQNIKSGQYKSLLQEYKNRCEEMESELKVTKRQKIVDVNTDHQNEISRLREELQCHVQTIGMLVAEKTELSATLNQLLITTKNETSESLELKTRLKASRSHVFELERELNILKAEKQQFDNSHKEYSSKIEKYKTDYQELKAQHEEVLQDSLESREKLKTSNEINLNFQKQIQELNGQLSLANVKIEQFTNGETTEIDGKMEKIMQERFAYEKQISDLNHSLRTISKERDEFSSQYQQYAHQLNNQIMGLAGRIEEYQNENGMLKDQEQKRIKHISELERQLQNLQNEQVSFGAQRNGNELRKELVSSGELVRNLQIEKIELNESLIKMTNEKELLVREVENNKYSISQLENVLEQLKGNQPDSAELLAAMESDKVAASRAMLQNNEIKRQMEGMQEVLLKVNNDNVVLTEKLGMEQNTNKELLEKLQRTEISLQTLADAIEIKDKELMQIRHNTEELDKQILHQGQLTDRLRHYEAQDHSTQSLKLELQDAKQYIAQLTNELHHLKNNSSIKTENNSAENVDAVMEELKEKLFALELRNEDLEASLTFLEKENASKKDSETDTNHNNTIDKNQAMQHLERKFLKTMEDIADLTEEKHRLEHLVLQLQSETETIGEYVALYQHQRSVLKQKAVEKDQQLKQLASDRENMKSNLDKLNQLVNQLVVEKGVVTKELLQQHEQFSQEKDYLCAEHAKIHHEINKITSDGFGDNQNMNHEDSNTEIADEIINLLSEIKSSNLIQPCDNIHHCAWCSGQLITV